MAHSPAALCQTHDPMEFLSPRRAVTAMAFLTAGCGAPDPVAPDATAASDTPVAVDAFVVDRSTDLPTTLDIATTDTATDTATDTVTDASADVPTDTATDAPIDTPVDAGATLVAVSHPRELRAAWVATVFNIDWPSRTGLSASQGQAGLTEVVDAASRAGLNALFFQVRSEGDAMYRSTLEPWSRFLTGRQGADPGWDPLAFLVDLAHRRGIEVHAWLNPYRARASATVASVAPHLSVTDPDATMRYGDALWMNPASPVVQDRLLRVIEDIAGRYDIDGVHFDDYFYPYPIAGIPFPDSVSFDSYRATGGALALADWRRDNVNRMVERVSRSVAALRPTLRFGISPFGIWRPGNPSGIVGLDAFTSIYCDAPTWMRRGWVDYLAPQLYWPSTQTAQAYGPLVRWWASTTSDGRSIFGGNYLSRLGTTAAWTLEEYRREVQLTRSEYANGARGNVWFSVRPLVQNTMGARDMFARDLYPRPALPPPMATRRSVVVAPPAVTANGRALRVSHPATTSLRSWALYAEVGGQWTLERVVPATAATMDLDRAGRWAVTAVGRDDVESAGVVFETR